MVPARHRVLVQGSRTHDTEIGLAFPETRGRVTVPGGLDLRGRTEESCLAQAVIGARDEQGRVKHLRLSLAPEDSLLYLIFTC